MIRTLEDPLRRDQREGDGRVNPEETHFVPHTEVYGAMSEPDKAGGPGRDLVSDDVFYPAAKDFAGDEH